MSCGSSGDNSNALLNQQYSNAKATNVASQQIQNDYSGFTPRFYQNYANSYVNSALPQLQQQYRQNANQFGFNMANQGLQKSTQSQQGYGALTDAMNSAKTQIAGQGQQAAQVLQQQVANQEGNLINMANTTSNPGQLGVMANASAASLQGPSTFAPIGQMLQGFANQYLGSQQAGLGNSLMSALQNFSLAPYLGGGSGGGLGSYPSNS